MAKRNFRIFRGDNTKGELVDYQVDVDEGMVVLDVIHRIQADQANDLAVRWNCKAGKCGSCSCEINGKPRLSCMTRMNVYGPEETITITPMKTFPVIKDLVTDLSWNYEQNKKIAQNTYLVLSSSRISFLIFDSLYLAYRRRLNLIIITETKIRKTG